jgi:hypothetical protein
MDGIVMTVRMLDGTREEALALQRARLERKNRDEFADGVFIGLLVGLATAGVCWLLGMVIL